MTGSPYARIAEGISLRQLRLFEAVGESNSVRRASDLCSLSQPAVTQSLSKLERHIGHVLVERSASGSFLNEDGKIFHARTARLFKQAIEAIRTIGPETEAEAATILNRLTRAQIRTLVAVCDHGRLSQAAEALEITAASLQRAACDLEANVGQPLFYRTAMGVLVNPKGLQLGRRLKLALQEIELGLAEIEDAHGISQRQIVIGAMPFGGSVLIAAILERFIQAHPGAAVRILSESAGEVIDRLKSGEVDLVVGLLPEEKNPDLACEPLAETPYVVAMRRGHPLSMRGRAALEELQQYDWIVGTKGSSRRAVFDRLFEGLPQSKWRLITGAIPIIRYMLQQSDRLTLMTSYELLHEPSLAAVDLDVPVEAPSMGLITRTDWKPTRLHSAFVDLLREFVAQPRMADDFRRAG